MNDPANYVIGKKRGNISVIIPTYNSSSLLKEVIQAVFESGILPRELIVVDDNSTFFEKFFIEQYPVLYVRLKKNYGPSVARNIGAGLASGEYLLFIDDDILIQKDTLELIESGFNTHQEVGAIVGLLSYRHPNKDLISRYKNFYMYHSLMTSPDRFGCLYTSISAVRKATFWKHGGFSENLKKASVEDVDLGQRLINSNEMIFLDKRLQVIHFKKYTLRSFVRNEFSRSYDLLAMLIKNNYMGKLFKQKRYLNNSPKVLISTVLCAVNLGIIAVSVFFPPLLTITTLILLILTCLNLSFIKEFAKYNPLWQTLLVPLMIMFDFTIASAGIGLSILHNITHIFYKNEDITNVSLSN